MSKMILTSYSQEELRNEFVEAFKEAFGRVPEHFTIDYCDGGKEVRLGDFREKKEKEPKEKYLTRGDVARFLKISLPTLHRYTKDCILKSYRIGGKVRYKLAEVESALKERNFGLPKRGGSHE